MLVLTRTTGKKIIIQTGTEEIEVAVLGLNGNQVRLGVQAPNHVSQSTAKRLPSARLQN